MDCTAATPKYPCTQKGLTNAIAAAGVDGTVIVPAGQTISVTSSTPLSVDGLTLRCERGATLSTAVLAAAPFYIQGVRDVGIEGCHFKYSSGAQVALVITKSATRVHFRHNVVDGYPAGGANIAVAIGDRTNTTLATANTDVDVQENVFVNDCGNQVDIADYNLRVFVSDNLFLPCAIAQNSELINAQTTDSGTVIEDLHIENNKMWNESGGDCVQVQPLRGGPFSISRVVVAQNICALVGGGGSGTGYSLSGHYITATKNVFTAAGETFAGGNPPFEIIDCSHCSETGDVGDMGTQSKPIVVFSAGSINMGDSIDDTFTRNACKIAESGTATAECFMAGASTPGTISRLTFVGNVADMSGSTSTGVLRAMWVQCNNPSARCMDGMISGNHFKGPNGSGIEQGVTIERDWGMVANWIVGRNSYSGWSSGNVGYSPGTLSPVSDPSVFATAHLLPTRSTKPRQSR
jgi:hypothetical protein